MGEKRARMVRVCASNIASRRCTRRLPICALALLGIVGMPSTAASQPAPPVLRMTAETSEIRVASPTAKLDQSFLLIPAADNDKLDGLSVRVDLADGDKRLWPLICTLDGRPCSDKLATPAGSAVLRIVAELPALGKYTGTIVAVAAAGKPAGTFALTVDRALAPLGLAVSGVATKLGQYNPLPWSEDFVEIWFALQETSGNALELQRPEIVGLAFKGNDDTSYQSSFQLRDGDGKELTGPIKLAAGQTTKVRLRMEGIDAAGHYTGKVRWSAAGKASIDTEFSAVVKEPWYMAFLCVLIGVLVGEAMRQYRKVVMPRQATQRDLIIKVKRYLDETTQPLPEWRRQVDAILRARVEQTLELLEDGVIVDEPLVEQLALSRKWVEIAGAVAALPEAQRAAFKGALDAARAALEDTPRKEAIAAADKSLTGIADAVRGAARTHASDQIDALLRNLDALGRSTAGLDPAELADTRQALQQTKAKLDANEAIATRTLFDAAALRYAGIVAKVLEHDSRTKPTGLIGDPAWKALTDELAPAIQRIRGAGDAETAIAAQAVARTTWLTGLIEGLAAVVEARRPQHPEVSGVDAPIAAARRALAAGDLDTAEQEYRNARKGYIPLATAGGFMGPAGAPPPGPVTELAALGGFVMPGKRKPPTIGDRWRRLRWKSRWYELLFVFASALIATLSGLQVLWVTNAIWGGWGARVLALFWGLGLHQVSGALVQGVGDVRTKIDGGTAP